MKSPVATQAYMAPHQAPGPANNFSGIFELSSAPSAGHIEVLVDSFNIAQNHDLQFTTLPSFSLSFVSDGKDIIPMQRGPQRSEHPYWEILIEPGISWDAADDNGWSRAVLPFALKEKRENCLHNGLMTFLYKSDGSSSRAAWQISSETCLYFKVNLWGVAETSYQPQIKPSASEVITAYRGEVARRLPAQPMEQLRNDYPGLDPFAFAPPGIDDASVYGLLLGGVHYRSDCPTRYGPYPYCEVMALPSYSLAKSMFASLAYQLLIERWPEFAAIPVADLVPECKLPDHRWDDVLTAHLLDMTTGNYDSQVVNEDDNSASMQAFFLAETHIEKARISCEIWPRKSTPGTRWAYHTSDTYLLGTAMNAFLRQKLGPEVNIYSDVLYSQVIQPIGLSPLLRWTESTYDHVRQPYTGYGLILHADDAVRFARALNSNPDMHRFLANLPFADSAHRTGQSSDAMYVAKTSYTSGFWGADASGWMDCNKDTWIPFMSGYGGINVAMFPNGGVYYYFTDSNQHGFQTAAVEANKALNYCKE
jgi:hypothetical protein